MYSRFKKAAYGRMDDLLLQLLPVIKKFQQ